MAERRMFAKSIVLSDAFLDMPMSARCLYFTLSMFADDDGFVGSPKAIMRQCGASQDDISVLLQKRYILGFDSGVIVIKHWRINNYLKNDRHKPTTYLEELNTLMIDKKKSYTEKEKLSMYPNGIQNVSTLDTQYSIGKDSIDKLNNISDKPKKHKYGNYNNVLLTDEELNKLKERFSDYEEKIKQLDEGIELKGYKYKSHYLAILKWAANDTKANKKSGMQGAYDIDAFEQIVNGKE